jgi:hypothetical protein
MEAANDTGVILTDNERELIRRALGLTAVRIAFRNYFITGYDGDDFDAWSGLVQRGLAVTWSISGFDGVHFAATMPAAKAVKGKDEGFGREVTADLMRIESSRRTE